LSPQTREDRVGDPHIPRGAVRDPSQWPIGGPQDIFYPASVTVPLPMIDRADGVYMWDEDGHRYIDVSSGPIVCNLGHGNRRVIEAMRAQAERVAFSYSRVSRTRVNIEFADQLCRLAGPGLERALFVSGGSEAVDMTIKFARQLAFARGEVSRTKVISCMPSYHGGTISTLAISGDVAMEPLFGDMAVFSTKVPAPLTYRLPENHDLESWSRQAAQAVEDAVLGLGPENVLAFIIEPVGGLATGANVPPDSYLRAVRRICDHHGVLMIFDEIMSGAGRTGRFLAAHHVPDAMPDLVALAKGIGAGYTPLGAMLAPARLVDELAGLTGFNYGHTYNANPVSCAAGCAVLSELEERDLVTAARTMGDHLRRRLLEIQERSAIIGDVRGRGLLMAIEIVADREAKTPFPADIVTPDLIRIAGLKRGLIIYSRRTSGGRFGDWIMVSPPLTVTAAELDEIAERLEATLNDVVDDLLPHIRG